VSDDLAESLAEGYVASATSAEDQGEQRHEQAVEEEIGGPFVLSTAGKEFADDVDESNPLDRGGSLFPRPARRKPSEIRRSSESTTAQLWYAWTHGTAQTR